MKSQIAMGRIFQILFFIATFVCCKSDNHISPSEIWSDACVSFKSDKGGYLLSGMCCEYLTISKINLKKDNSFKSSAKYFTHTGAGYNETPVTVSGKISDDRNLLDFSFEVQGVSKKFNMKSGGPTAACYCGCD